MVVGAVILAQCLIVYIFEHLTTGVSQIKICLFPKFPNQFVNFGNQFTIWLIQNSSTHSVYMNKTQQSYPNEDCYFLGYSETLLNGQFGKVATNKVQNQFFLPFYNRIPPLRTQKRNYSLSTLFFERANVIEYCTSTHPIDQFCSQ